MANGGREIPNGIEQDPLQDLLANLLVDQFLAQQDITRVSDPREERAPQGEVENFLMNLIQGADPTMGLASGMAGLTPDDPDFKTQIAIGLLTGGGLGALLRAGGRGVMRAGRSAGEALERLLAQIGSTGESAVKGIQQGRTARLIDDIERRAFGDLPGDVAKKGEEARLLGEIRADRALREGRELLTDTEEATRRRDLGGIREQIFRDLLKEDPFGEADEAHELLIEMLERLARERGGR